MPKSPVLHQFFVALE